MSLQRQPMQRDVDTLSYGWSALHLKPESLHRKLRDYISGVQRVLLGFGFCGNATIRLMSKDFGFVCTKVDDCITLLLGSTQTWERCARDGGVYFLTKVWLEAQQSVWKEHQTIPACFGPVRTERVYRRKLPHYQYLRLIDTGACDPAGLLQLVRELAAALKLEAWLFSGTDQYLRQLLSGLWNTRDFVIVPSRTVIPFSHLGLDSTARAFSFQGAS